MQSETLSTHSTDVAPVIATQTGDDPLIAFLRNRPKSRSLAGRTMDALAITFLKHAHYPSDEMWVALRAVAETLQAMADGDADPLIYLSSLDPGVGKTQTYIHFIREMLEHPDYDGVAVIVCISRKDQIRAVVDEAKLQPDDFAVLTADAELNALGSGNPNSARVLFTTQRMVESRCQHGTKAFEDVAAFHYRGKPRAVRIWDEAILPGQTLTVSRDDVGLLFKPLRFSHPNLTAALEQLFIHLGTLPDGEIITLPNFAEDHGVTLNDVMGLVEHSTESTKAAVECLWFLSGRTVTVRQDGAYGNTVLDYKDTLPDDIKPLIVLDASIRVRSIYDLWEGGRGGVVRLPDAEKRYSELTLHVWRHGGGKSAFRRNGPKLIEGIASTILIKPGEEWLGVHHKDAGLDFERQLSQILPDDVTPRVRFLTWGSHDATNAFAHVPNVILAGILFYRGSHYEALGRLAAGKSSAAGPFPQSETQSASRMATNAYQATSTSSRAEGRTLSGTFRGYSPVPVSYGGGRWKRRLPERSVRHTPISSNAYVRTPGPLWRSGTPCGRLDGKTLKSLRSASANTTTLSMPWSLRGSRNTGRAYARLASVGSLICLPRSDLPRNGKGGNDV
jgi:hypothetical protein